LHKNNIHNGLFISPIFPEITNWKQIILKTKSFVDEYWFENLNLRADYKKTIMKYIKEKYPQHMDLYKNIYVKKDNSYWDIMSLEIEQFCKKHKIKYINYFYHEKIRKK
jgi:DNA repair photolyase